MGTEYHRLGDYIRPVDVRNRDLLVTELVGHTIEKTFISSVEIVIGTEINIVRLRKNVYLCSLKKRY